MATPTQLFTAHVARGEAVKLLRSVTPLQVQLVYIVTALDHITEPVSQVLKGLS